MSTFNKRWMVGEKFIDIANAERKLSKARREIRPGSAAEMAAIQADIGINVARYSARRLKRADDRYPSRPQWHYVAPTWVRRMVLSLLATIRKSRRVDPDRRSLG